MAIFKKNRRFFSVPLYVSLIVSLMVVLSSCSQFSPGLQKPNVVLENITLANDNLLSPRFTLSLRISNPNGVALPVKGMSYAINILGVDLFDGVTNKIPRVEAYSDAVVDLELGTNILKAAKLLRVLTSRVDNKISYGVDAKIDLNGLLPSFKVNESGFVTIPQ